MVQIGCKLGELENRKTWKVCKLHQIIPNQTQGIGRQKHPIYVHCRTSIKNFRPFQSLIIRFQDIAHFKIFPLTPVLKVQGVAIFLFFLQITKTFIILHSFMIALFIITSGSDRRTTVGGVAFGNFQPHMVLF